MKNKTTLLIVIVFIAAIFVIILNDNYLDKMGDKKVECKFVVEYNNYDEDVTFYYKKNKIIKYERKEVFYDSKEHPIKEIYEIFKEKADKYKDSISDSFKYTVKLKNNIVYIDTFIDAEKESEVFSNYIGGIGIKATYTPEEVKKTLDGTNYECTIK